MDGFARHERFGFVPALLTLLVSLSAAPSAAGRPFNAAGAGRALPPLHHQAIPPLGAAPAFSYPARNPQAREQLERAAAASPTDAGRIADLVDGSRPAPPGGTASLLSAVFRSVSLGFDLKTKMERLASDLTGMPASIETASFSLFSGQGRIDRLVLRDALGSPSLQVSAIDFRLDTASLLSGPLRFKSVELNGVSLPENGRPNIPTPSSAGDKTAEVRPVIIDKLTLRNAHVRLSGPRLRSAQTLYLRDMEWGPVSIGEDGIADLCGPRCMAR